MLINLLLLIVGFAFLIKGADFLIDGAVSLAKKFHISEIAIGLTVVAFGTSAPELIVNIVSAFQNHPEICYGNVIGSNMFNTLVVLGLAGLFKPLLLQKSTVRKEIPFVFLGTILIILLSNGFWIGDKILSRYDGLILIGCLVIFIIYVMKIPRQQISSEYSDLPVLKTILFLIFGIIGLFAGGQLVVDNAVKIALYFKVSNELISLTIVAFGTSLPELVTSLIALKKKSSDIAVGNVIGSNLFNIFMVLGVTSLIKPVIFNPSLNIDLAILALITLILFLLVFVGKVSKLNKFEAAILLLCYSGYMYFLLQRG
ncbi:MAG: calcium/sodium antiporter [Candidatus Stygibacter australis]|nr:calcium/sodium antiporter [Candidatus Stygibacter australis]MDP8321536.1 calcium/sodium antiporter [Candidatus Stygibacter australis]